MATITSPRAISPNPSRITSPSLPSASGTPTSSVRPSIDLSGNVAASLSAPGSQRRNRAALRNYYNLKSRPSASSPELQRTASHRSDNSDSTIASAATLPGAQSDHVRSVLPPQLDDPSFDAERYISDLLKTSTLQDILRAEGTLVSEIRNLDGERKALVYDNYSKLIKAVGTIGEMQKGMRDGDGEAGINGVKGLGDKLETLIGLIEQTRAERTGAGVENARQARKHREQRKKQDLVRWVLAAPARLEEMIENSARSDAEKDYQRVQELLDQWEGVKGVAEIRKQCEEIMKEPENTESDDEAG